MSKPKTVGEIPLGGGGGFPWWGVVVLILIAGVGWWYFANRAADAKREAANVAARADTLETRLLDAERGLKEAEIRALTGADAEEVAAALSDELAQSLRQQRLQARAVADLRAEIRDHFEVEGQVEQVGDTTRVHAEREDSTFSAAVDMTIVGDQATAEFDLAARLRAMLAITCDEDGAPHAHAETFDRRVSVVELRATVDEDVTCFGNRPPGFFSFKPQLTVGNGLLAGGAFVLGYLVAGK